MRTIVRFSVDRENNSALRNKLAGVLRRAGFTKARNTGTYEHGQIGEAGVCTVLGTFWNAADNHPGPGRIDHFWMYSDRRPVPRRRLNN